MAEGQILGLADVKKALKDLPGTIQRRAVRAGLTAASRLVRDMAKAAAPEGKTGALKRNIQQKMGKIRGNSIFAYVGVEAGKVPRSNAEGKVTFKTRRGKVKSRKLSARENRGEDPYYYKFQETGYTAVGRRKARGRLSRKFGGATKGRKIPGKFFLRNALENNTGAVVDAFVRAAKERIERGG